MRDGGMARFGMGGWEKMDGWAKKKTKEKNYETSVVPAYRVPYTLFLCFPLSLLT